MIKKTLALILALTALIYAQIPVYAEPSVTGDDGTVTETDTEPSDTDYSDFDYIISAVGDDNITESRFTVKVVITANEELRAGSVTLEFDGNMLKLGSVESADDRFKLSFRKSGSELALLFYTDDVFTGTADVAYIEADVLNGAEEELCLISPVGASVSDGKNDYIPETVPFSAVFSNTFKAETTAADTNDPEPDETVHEDTQGAPVTDKAKETRPQETEIITADDSETDSTEDPAVSVTEDITEDKDVISGHNDNTGAGSTDVPGRGSDSAEPAPNDKGSAVIPIIVIAAVMAAAAVAVIIVFKKIEKRSGK